MQTINNKQLHSVLFVVTAIVILLSNASAIAAPQESYKLDFAQKYQQGSRYHCAIIAEMFKNTRVENSSGSSSRPRHLKSILSGTMTVTATTPAGMIKEIDFAVKTFTGFIEQRQVPSKLNGKILQVILTPGKPAQMNLKNNIMQPLSKQEQGLLSLIFPSVLKDDLASLLGNRQKLAIGDSWIPPEAKFFMLFKQHGIKYSHNQLKARAKLSGRETLQTINCLIAEEHLKTLNIPDFKFTFNMKVWLPIDTPSSNALRIQRQAVWRASATLPQNNPLVSIHSISTTVMNSMDFTAVPF